MRPEDDPDLLSGPGVYTARTSVCLERGCGALLTDADIRAKADICLSCTQKLDEEEEAREQERGERERERAAREARIQEQILNGPQCDDPGPYCRCDECDPVYVRGEP